MTSTDLDQISAQVDETSPYYLSELIAALRQAWQQSAQARQKMARLREFVTDMQRYEQDPVDGGTEFCTRMLEEIDRLEQANGGRA